MMSYLTSRIRAGSIVVSLLVLLLLLPGWAQAQFPTLPAVPTTCSYTTAPATVSLTASAASSGFSTTYLLVDMTSGIIVKANATTPVFTSVPAGIYYAVAAHYTGTITNASAGNLISQVYSSNQCLSYGTPLALKVCAAAGSCDAQTAPASISFTAANVPSGVSTSYALVDQSTNKIVQLSSTPSFSGLAVGDYAVTAVHYTGSLTTLTVGSQLYNVVNNATNCRNVSQSLNIRVCNAPLVITSPATGTVVAGLNPPISGTSTPGSSVTVTGSSGTTGGPCVATTNSSGVWTCTSLTFPAGPVSVTATNGATSAISSFTAVTPTTVTINSPSNTYTSVNPTISGSATPNSAVTITGPSNTTLCSTTASASGNFACVVTVPTGPVTVTATATNAGGITSATTSFTALPAPPPPVFPPYYTGVGPLTQPISGTTTPGDQVVITGPGNTTLCSTTASASGTFSCSVTVPTGPSTLTVTTSNPGGSTSTPISVTGVDAPMIGTTGPSGTQTSTTPTVSGTATPGSVVTITGPGNTTLCSTTATAGGSYSCTVTVPAGPNTLTVTAANPGGTASSPISFTAVDPPTRAAINPPAPGPLTQPISGTTTPGSQVVITGPGNTTLCSTVASASGVFSCSVSIPSGPSTLTVTTSGPGGTTSTPISVTGVDAPTIGATGPSGTQTSTTPTVSGTATPGSVVTITGPGNATLCSTTATAGGSYSCTVTVPTGPNTLTVMASNPGGTASSPISFTATDPRLFVSVYLQGALIANGGNVSSTGKPLMRDNLRVGGYLPLSDPYRSATYSNLFAQVNNAENQAIAASLTAVTGENAIVDWVFVELRDKTTPTTVRYTRSGLLLRNGTVIDSDGQVGLKLGSASDDYYVAIRHRNHLAIMTQQPVSLSGTSATVDFINLPDAQIWNASGYDGAERSRTTASAQSVRAMWAGNTTGSGKVKYSGSGSGLSVLLSNIVSYPGGTGAFNYTNAYGYLNGDVNMDGRALYIGNGNDGAIILGNIVAYPLNGSGVYNYNLMTQQLP